MLFYICIGLLICEALIILPYLVLNAKITRRLFCCFSVVTVMCLAYIAFCFNPGTYNAYNSDYVYHHAVFDVVRYHIEIDALRGVGIGDIIRKTVSSPEPMRIFLFYLFSKFESDNWISFFSVLVTLGIFQYFIYQFAFSEKFRNKNPNLSIGYLGGRELAFVYLMLFAAIDYIEIINTCRCVMAYAVIALAIFQIYFFDWKWTSYILLILAAFLHISGWAIIILLFCFRIFPAIYKARYIAMFWQLAILPIIFITSNIPLPYFDVLSYRLMLYQKVGAANGMEIYWIVLILTFLSLIYIIDKILKKTVIDQRYRILQFIQILLFIMVGGYRSVLSLRLFYFMGLLSPIFILLACRKFHFRYRQLVFGIVVTCLIGCCIYHTRMNAIYISLAGATWR